METYISGFIGLSNSIVGIFAILLCVIILTNSSSYSLWLGFGFCAFMASLVAPPHNIYFNPAPLAFPFEELRDFGRPITILILLSLSFRYFTSGQKSFRNEKIPRQIFYLFITLFVINVKNFLGGDIGFALLNATIIAFLWLLIKSLWDDLNYNQNLNLAVYAVAFGGLFFAGSSLYQSIFDVTPLIFANGQFVGMTSNPQMTGLIFSFTLPSLLFTWENSNQSSFFKNIFLLGILITFFLIYLTGSRTALIASCACLLAYYYKRPIKSLQLLFSIAVVILVADTAFPGFSDNLLNDSVIDSSSDLATQRFTNITDTRTQVWGILWSQFLENPLFGIPLTGGRIGFGENTWFAVAASLGLMGLIPLLLFGFSSARLFIGINKYLFSTNNNLIESQIALINASYVVIFFNSIAEAYLLGSLTFPLFAAIIYLLIGTYVGNQLKPEHQKPE